MNSGGLIAGQVQSVFGWANEFDSVFGALACQIRTLRQETIARVNRVRTGFLRSANDFVDVQICLDRLSVRTNPHCLIGEGTVERVAVFFRIHRDGTRAGLESGAECANGNFTAVSNKNFVEGWQA